MTALALLGLAAVAPPASARTITVTASVVESTRPGGDVLRRSGDIARFPVDERWKRSNLSPKSSSAFRTRRFSSRCSVTMSLGVRVLYRYALPEADPSTFQSAREYVFERRTPSASGTLRNAGRASGGISTPGAWLLDSPIPDAIQAVGAYRFDKTRPVGDVVAVQYALATVNALLLKASCRPFRAIVNAAVRKAAAGYQVRAK